jgi:hypothetical protein
MDQDEGLTVSAHLVIESRAVDRGKSVSGEVGAAIARVRRGAIEKNCHGKHGYPTDCCHIDFLA